MTLADLRVPEDPRRGQQAPADIKAQGLVWRHRHKNGDEMDMEVIWSPLAFRGQTRGADAGHGRDRRGGGSAQRNSVFGQSEPQFERGHHGIRGRHVHLRSGG